VAVGFALAMVAGLAACSSAPSPGASLAAAVAACKAATPARLPAATGQQPGDIQWSASLGRCTKNSGQTWSPSGLTSPTTWGHAGAGPIVYLNPEASSEHPAPARRIDRLDAATGRLLAPLTLDRALGFDLSAESGNDFGQGLLLLGISSPSPQTVAVDPGSGAVKWAYPGDVVSEGGLFTYFDQGSDTLTAISPGSGQAVWSLQRSGLNTEGGPEALLATPGYVAAWSPAADGRWVVTGLRPGGGTAWTFSRFPGAVFLANDASTVYVITCTPWKRDQSGVCAEVSLAAVAA
jgi:hypothetical protein